MLATVCSKSCVPARCGADRPSPGSPGRSTWPRPSRCHGDADVSRGQCSGASLIPSPAIATGGRRQSAGSVRPCPCGRTPPCTSSIPSVWPTASASRLGIARPATMRRPSARNAFSAGSVVAQMGSATRDDPGKAAIDCEEHDAGGLGQTVGLNLQCSSIRADFDHQGLHCPVPGSRPWTWPRTPMPVTESNDSVAEKRQPARPRIADDRGGQRVFAALFQTGRQTHYLGLVRPRGRDHLTQHGPGLQSAFRSCRRPACRSAAVVRSYLCIPEQHPARAPRGRSPP